jgi:putative NADH-flavin reductase
MIGQRIVREALARGHAVTVVVRDVSKVRQSDERVTILSGDVLDPAIGSTLGSTDVVISAVGTARAEHPDYSLYRRAAESLVSALRALPGEAPRLIVVGGVGTCATSLASCCSRVSRRSGCRSTKDSRPRSTSIAPPQTCVGPT